MTDEQRAKRLHYHMYETCEGIQEHAERIVKLEELVLEYTQLSQNGMVICLDIEHNLQCSHFWECPGGRGRCALVRAARELGIEVN